MKDKATYILKGDTIFTSAADQTVSGAVIVKDDRIVDVVGKDGIHEYIDENTIVYDFEDKLIMPGIIDAHTHYFMAAVSASDYMCTDIASSTSEYDAIQIMKGYEDSHPDEKRLFGIGWYPANWGANPLPTKASLDRAFPDIPVYLISGDCHTAWLNTAGLKELGIDRNTKVNNGEVRHGNDGEPNGLLIEMDAMAPVFAKLYDMDEDRMKEVNRDFFKFINSLGITSLSEMTANDYTEANHHCYEMIRGLEDTGEMTVRLHLYPRMEGITDFSVTKKLLEEYHSDMFKVAGVKGFVDGVMSTYTAYLLEPYDDRPDTTGEGAPTYPQNEMQNYVAAANAAGFPVRLHCIGDAAIRMALDMYSLSNEKNPGHKLANTIEHIERIHPDDIDRFKELGVIPSMQPRHLPLEKNEKFDRVGLERSKTAWAHNTILKSGAKLAFGTDFPVVELNPFPNIYAAVTRCDEYGEEMGNNPWEKITLAETLISYTKYAAEAYSRGNELGTLEPGKFADITVVDRNLFDIDKNEIQHANALFTMMGGNVVYDVR